MTDAPYLQDERGASLKDKAEPNNSGPVLDALRQSEKAFRAYHDECNRIDSIYSAKLVLDGRVSDLGMSDNAYDTFWASMEVLKPAIYAKPPKVVAKPRYSDASPADKVAAEIIERVVNSEFERSNIDTHLKDLRDDLALLNRGVLRVTYESNDGDKHVCVDHVDRLDYRHDPVRYWREMGWEAFCAWLTEPEMKERFGKHSGDAYKQAGFVSRTANDDEGNRSEVTKAPVWEVWSKTDNRVYWVTEGVDVMLDESEPFITTRDFFSSPRPAYGTVRRRTLVPIPDYRRYEQHIGQINTCTDKIYTLLQQIRMMGLVAGGGDVAEAVQVALSSTEAMTIVPVPGAALMASGGAGNFVQWLPLVEIATAIQGLIEARNQLFADFDRLSGISDIMRGETEAEETLGAQRLKSQYGSVRVRDKVDEVVRVSRDTARIAVEIVCDNFSKDDLLEIAQMDLPSKADVTKDIEGIKKAAKTEAEALTAKVKEEAAKAQQAGQEVPPEAEQAAQQALQQIAQKWAEKLQALQQTVTVEMVMEVIKDKRARSLAIDIETDSTVLSDELAEKQMCNELLAAFSGAIGSMLPLFQIGEPGVKLAVAILERTLQPYTQGNRQIQSTLDELIEQAPEIAAKMAQQQGGEDDGGLAEANKKLAEAEGVKAQAAMAGVQAKAQLDQANSQLKFAQLQQQAQDAERKAQHENEKLKLQIADADTKARQAQQKQQAEIDNLTAQTAKILASIGLDERKQQLSEYTAADQAQARQVDQAMAVEGQQQDAQFRSAEHERADRQQDFTEQNTDRQQTFAEKQAMTQGDD